MENSPKRESELTAAIREALAANLPLGKVVAVALSGGMDSSSLLDAVLPLSARWPIIACHVNHGLSPSAAAWERFCAEVCHARGVPLHIARATPSGAGSEEWARNARMRAFARLPAAAVLAAHHADDQAETVLFRVLRGTGLPGMGAMRICAPLPGATGMLLLRPWLNIPRTVIAAYARRRQLAWVEDEDNSNVSRRRNFLRRRAMPVLREGFPDSGRILAAAAGRFAAGADLLAALATADESLARAADGGLRVADFRRLGEARIRNWLHVALLSRGARFSERGLAEAARQIVANGGDGLCFRFHGAEAETERRLTLRVWRGHLHWDHLPPPPKDFARALSCVPGRHECPEIGGTLIMRRTCGVGLAGDKIGGVLWARLPRGGERVWLSSHRARALSDLMREAKIAPWRRRLLPLLFADSELAVAPGIAVAAPFRAKQGEEGLECRFEWS